MVVNFSLNQILFDILAICKTELEDSVDSSNVSVRGYTPLIWKRSVTQIHGLACFVKESFFLHTTYLWKTLKIFMFSTGFTPFDVSLYFLLSIFFFQSFFELDELLLINPSANIFAFRDFSIHHRD